MYTVIAKFTVLQGKLAEATAAVNQLAKNVMEQEAGTLAYLPHTVSTDGYNNPVPYDGEIVFYEIYADKAAFELHLNGPYGPDHPSGLYTEFVKHYGHLFLCSNSDGKPYVQGETLKHIDGFIRKELAGHIIHD